MSKIDTVAQAREVARALLENSGNRWVHVQGVGEKAEAIAPLLFDTDESRIFCMAAWMHDIGYSDRLNKTGWHPTDAALWLREQGVDERVVSLVACHHTYTDQSAKIGQFEAHVPLFTKKEGVLQQAMVYVDMTTGPKGENYSSKQRINEIVDRYGAGHVNARGVVDGSSCILEAENRLRRALGTRVVKALNSALTL